MERLKLKGAYEEKRMHSQELAARAAGIIRALRDLAMPAAITPLSGIKTEEIKEFSTLLHEIKTQYVQLVNEMAELKEEIG